MVFEGIAHRGSRVIPGQLQLVKLRFRSDAELAVLCKHSSSGTAEARHPDVQFHVNVISERHDVVQAEPEVAFQVPEPHLVAHPVAIKVVGAVYTTLNNSPSSALQRHVAVDHYGAHGGARADGTRHYIVEATRSEPIVIKLLAVSSWHVCKGKFNVADR